MKGHIIRAILYQDMTVKWKNVEEGIPARLNVHQKARQFVEVELGDFLLAEDEAILAAFEKVKDGNTNHINPTVMEQVVGDKKVYRLQIPPEVHNEAGEWEIQFFIETAYNVFSSDYESSSPSWIARFVEYSSITDDGLTVPTGENLKELYNAILKTCDDFYASGQGRGIYITAVVPPKTAIYAFDLSGFVQPPRAIGDLVLDMTGMLWQVKAFNETFAVCDVLNISLIGPQGFSPYIGENGNWWIGDTDTGVKANGASNLENGSGKGSIQQKGYTDENAKEVLGAIASGEGAVAFGGQRYDKAGEPIEAEPITEASGKQAFAFGGGNLAAGDWALAGNKDTKALQRSDTAFGGGSRAGRTYEEWLEFKGLTASDANLASYKKEHHFAFAQGQKSTAKGVASAAFNNSTANGLNSFSCNSSTANGNASFASGYSTNANGVYSATFGAYTVADGRYSFAAGDNSNAIADTSFAFGKETEANAVYSAAFGAKSIANGSCSFVAGSNVSANHYAAAFGNATVAEGIHSFAAGYDSKATGNASAAFGANNEALGYSLVAGDGNTAHPYSLVGGHNNIGLNASIVGGSQNFAGRWSIVGGYNNTVAESYDASFLSGRNNQMIGSDSAAIGQLNVVNGNYSAAIGYENSLEKNFSYAFGNRLRAFQGQLVTGMYNAENTSAAFIIGGGNATNRKNIFEVYKDGRAKVYAAPQENNDVVRLQELNEVKNDLNTFFADADVTTNAIDTLKEIQNYITMDGEAAAALLASIEANAASSEANSNAIEDLSNGLRRGSVVPAKASCADTATLDGTGTNIAEKFKELRALIGNTDAETVAAMVEGKLDKSTAKMTVYGVNSNGVQDNFEVSWEPFADGTFGFIPARTQDFQLQAITLDEETGRDTSDEDLINRGYFWDKIDPIKERLTAAEESISAQFANSKNWREGVADGSVVVGKAATADKATLLETVNATGGSKYAFTVPEAGKYLVQMTLTRADNKRVNLTTLINVPEAQADSWIANHAYVYFSHPDYNSGSISEMLVTAENLTISIPEQAYIRITQAHKIMEYGV